MGSVAAECGVCKNAVRFAIQWVEDTLIEDGAFAPPGKKALERKSNSIQCIVADVPENPINRPKEVQKECCSGKNGAR
jgi:hypothetical protein